MAAEDIIPYLDIYFLAAKLGIPALQDSLLVRIRAILHSAGDKLPAELLCPVLGLVYRNGRSGCMLKKFFAHLAIYNTCVKGEDPDIYVACVDKVDGFSREILRAVKETEDTKSIPNPCVEGSWTVR